MFKLGYILLVKCWTAIVPPSGFLGNKYITNNTGNSNLVTTSLPNTFILVLKSTNLMVIIWKLFNPWGKNCRCMTCVVWETLLSNNRIYSPSHPERCAMYCCDTLLIHLCVYSKYNLPPSCNYLLREKN
jgi:hypothetical protein